MLSRKYGRASPKSGYKKIFIVALSRADYWLLAPLMKDFSTRDHVDLNLILSKDLHRNSAIKEQLKQLGVRVKLHYITNINTKKVEKSILKSVSSLIFQVDGIIKNNRSAPIIILGDRFEIFTVAFVCFLGNYKLIHISGGEKTTGSKDDEYRKAISFFSNLHFVRKDQYKNNLIQLGIPEDKIFSLGDLANDSILTSYKSFLTKSEILRKYQINTDMKYLLVTYHPNTRIESQTCIEIEIILNSLEKLTDFFVIFTSANVDIGGLIVNKKIRQWALRNYSRSRYFENLGSLDYLNLAYFAECVLGNSSSGITEIPPLGTPTINVGNRQSGRERHPSITDVDFNVEVICQAVNTAKKRKVDDVNLKPAARAIANKILEVFIS